MLETSKVELKLIKSNLDSIKSHLKKIDKISDLEKSNLISSMNSLSIRIRNILKKEENK